MTAPTIVLTILSSHPQRRQGWHYTVAITRDMRLRACEIKARTQNNVTISNHHVIRLAPLASNMLLALG
jgi:hypothetical protein